MATTQSMSMKTMNKNIFVFLSLLFILSCEKKDLETPKENEIADSKKIKAGVLAMVNNNSFVSVMEATDTVNLLDPNAVDVNQQAPYYATYGSNDSSLIILADGELGNNPDSIKYAKILLWITRFKGPDTYKTDDFSSYCVFSIVDSAYNLRQFVSSGTPTGNVTINNFDTTANIISGSFEFTAISNDSVLVVKNGVFNTVKIN